MAYDDSIYRDTERGFRQWARSELVAPNSTGKWVPNPGDLVFDKDQGFLLVMEVDYSTGYSTLETWTPPDNNPEDADGKLIGVGPGYSSESYRMFLDTSVTPHAMSPDRRLRFYGTMVDHYKVFRGADISQTHGKVISAMFDTAGNFLGADVPVEPISEAEKALAGGYTSERMPNGELVTIVAYDDQGGAVSQAQLVIVNSNVIRQADASKKYIQAIALESPFISSADQQVIEFPLNVTVESLPLTAVVYYSDGTRYRSTIDNNRFFLNGLRDYIATEVGQEFPMVLTYNLGEDEISYNLTPTANRRLAMDYIARTVTADGAYEVKIFAFPLWVNAATGYRMEYWLYNLDRQVYYNVTPYMELGSNSNPFDPKAYGVVQNFTMALDLNKVDGRFAPYRHVQVFRLALLNSGDGSQVNWEIYQTPEQVDGFGRGLFADVEYMSTNIWKLRLQMGVNTSAQWLNKLYYPLEPLFDNEIEPRAPEPTHFILQFRHNSYRFNISQWADVLTVNNDLKDGELLYIHWERENYDTVLQLGVTALPIRQRT